MALPLSRHPDSWSSRRLLTIEKTEIIDEEPVPAKTKRNALTRSYAFAQGTQAGVPAALRRVRRMRILA